jgi:SOS response regulatory protein OraA/RecX
VLKLGKNASVTSVILSEAHGEEAMKNSRVSEWHKQFKENFHAKITNEDNAHHFLQYRGYSPSSSPWRGF